MTEKFNFTKVSKSYMGYSNMKPSRKMKFWLRFPFAYIKWNYFNIKHDILWRYYNGWNR